MSIHIHIGNNILDHTYPNLDAYACTCIYIYIGASLVSQTVKNVPVVQETQVQFLD